MFGARSVSVPTPDHGHFLAKVMLSWIHGSYPTKSSDHPQSQRLGRAPVAPGDRVCVDIECGRRPRVGETRRDDHDRYSDVEHLRCHEVAEIVQSRVLLALVVPVWALYTCTLT